jgi:hypothetical protein
MEQDEIKWYQDLKKKPFRSFERDRNGPKINIACA